MGRHKGCTSPNKGKIGIYHHSEKTKKKISDARKGISSEKKGKTYEEIYGKEKANELKQKLSENAKNNPNYGNKGKSFSKETRKKMSRAQQNMSLQTRENMSKAQKGRVLSRKHIQKIRTALIGRSLSNEHKKNIRIGNLKNIEQNYGIPYPAYNKKACEYFKRFDNANNTQGRYAIYGEGEYFIKELGYFPDYINFDLKLIIEWDEEFHFNSDRNLRKKDVQRQKEIQEFFPDFVFIRIKENDYSGFLVA